MKIIRILKILLLVLIINSAAYGQCKGFIKGKCMPKLKPYLNTQQMCNTVLLSGDKTQLTSSFYYGDQYRIIVCADDALGKVQLNIRDVQNNIVFTTKGYGTIMWDFDVESTQDLTLEVITPPIPENETVDKSGCVSIILGFK